MCKWSDPFSKCVPVSYTHLPSYLRIKAFVDSLPKRPVVGAFTATATAHVREDIRTHLELHTPYEVTTSFCLLYTSC